MSELLPCKLCGVVPTHRADGLMAHGTWNSECPLWESSWMTPEQWTKLMGQGYIAEGDDDLTIAYMAGFHDGKKQNAPPQAQGDDVLRDAMRYRWLRENNRAESKAGLTLMDRLYDVDGDEFDMHVDAAMK